jgi:hypothetical protein
MRAQSSSRSLWRVRGVGFDIMVEIYQAFARLQAGCWL